jgi:hypothetical protein
MAFTYDAGLRIRPPEPMPDCLAGESSQDYFSRALTQCSIESATTSENSSGDSAPTPFNLGQIQADVARNTADIDTLETQVGDLETSVTALQGVVAAGSATYASGATTVTAVLPSDGGWRVVVTPVNQTLDGLYITVSSSSFTATFTAAGAAGLLHWLAYKVS